MECFENFILTEVFRFSRQSKGKIVKIKRNNPNAHILIVDDNSPDGTGIEINKLKKQLKIYF